MKMLLNISYDEQNEVRVKLKIAQVSDDFIKVVSKMETLLQTP
jgi:hypothetical protein